MNKHKYLKESQYQLFSYPKQVRAHLTQVQDSSDARVYKMNLGRINNLMYTSLHNLKDNVCL